MGRRGYFEAILAGAAAALLALPAAAQNAPAAPQPSGQQSGQQAGKSGKKKDAKGQKSGDDSNAFPEAQSEKAAQEAQQGDTLSAPAPESTASAPAPQTQGKPAADQNPFPEAKSEQAQQQAQRAQQQSQQEQQQSQADSSSSAIKGLNGPQLQSLPGTNSNQVLSPALGKQDVKVGTFYLQTGDYKGAYSRFLEATQVDPGDAEAVYGLAEAARNLGKRTVAIQNFQLYLAALPDGPRAKDCRKALKQMGAKQ